MATRTICCAPPINLAPTWLVLDANRPEPLAALYAAPDSEPRLIPAATFGPIHVLEIVPR